MWVCASTMPGMTVALERSITFAPAGRVNDAASETLWILLPFRTMTWLCFAEFEVPSIGPPARMTVVWAKDMNDSARNRADRRVSFIGTPESRKDSTLVQGSCRLITD